MENSTRGALPPPPALAPLLLSDAWPAEEHAGAEAEEDEKATPTGAGVGAVGHSSTANPPPWQATTTRQHCSNAHPSLAALPGSAAAALESEGALWCVGCSTANAVQEPLRAAKLEVGAG
eukprot:scaffold76187_cov17-Tisochrysis_lutea.AAC.3